MCFISTVFKWPYIVVPSQYLFAQNFNLLVSSTDTDVDVVLILATIPYSAQATLCPPPPIKISSGLRTLSFRLDISWEKYHPPPPRPKWKWNFVPDLEFGALAWANVGQNTSLFRSVEINRCIAKLFRHDNPVLAWALDFQTEIHVTKPDIQISHWLLLVIENLCNIRVFHAIFVIMYLNSFTKVQT